MNIRFAMRYHEIYQVYGGLPVNTCLINIHFLFKKAEITTTQWQVVLMDKQGLPQETTATAQSRPQ